MYPQVSGGTTPTQGQASYDTQFSSVVVQQPTPAAPGVPMVPGQPVTWMPPPGSIQGCPAGLEYLSHLDQVVIKQEASLIEVLVGWEAKNKFRLLNSMGQQIYFATEESGMCQRQCCGSSRGFIYHFTDNANQEVFRVRRDFRCCTGLACCPCEMCRYYGVCEDRNGQVLGYISNLCFCCSPRFGIFDEQRRLVAEVKGPCCPWQCVCGCTADINFPVIDVGNHTEIGTIKKQWTGFFKDMVTDCDNFAVLFPVNTEVKKKALMIGAVFIIDMMLYEHSQDSGGAGA